jgi:hypothetical protein
MSEQLHSRNNDFVLSIDEQHTVRRILDEMKRRGYYDAEDPVLIELRRRLWSELAARQAGPTGPVRSGQYMGD